MHPNPSNTEAGSLPGTDEFACRASLPEHGYALLQVQVHTQVVNVHFRLVAAARQVADAAHHHHKLSTYVGGQQIKAR